MMKTGDTYRNFTVKLSKNLPEIESSLLEVEHKPSGAIIMMIINNDDENVFNICFRTCPQTSNGVAHVLEHMVLCGSENYPVRDPFFSMTRRSLNTFMNAFTGADFTCYPAASQIPEDFYNLLSVYIDAVFSPLLSKNSFLQEGWRYEISPDEKLVYTGIVFNEMKGALMSGEARLFEALNAAIFPSVTYGVNSGGNPKEITHLTLDAVRAFHQQQYTLNRCLFYFYGNIKPTRHLDFLEEKLLRRVGKMEKQSLSVPLQKRFKEPVRSIFKYPSDSQDEHKVLFGLTWLTCSILDQQELLAIHILDLVLMGTDAAPLKSRLLKSGFCSQVDMCIDSELREIPVTIVCKGCSHASAQKLESLIFSCLEEIEQEGLPSHLVEGAVHQIEFSRKEITGYSLPYGLSLFFRSGLLRLHGGVAEDGLCIHTLFHGLREKLKEPRYLENIIRKYFLNNTHFARIILLPDADLVAHEAKAERALLDTEQKKLSDNDIAEIKKMNQALEQYQESSEDVDKILPNFNLDKVSHSGKEFDLVKHCVSYGEVFYHCCFTNDLLFVDLFLDLPPLSTEELPWLRLLVGFILQLGCGNRTYKEHLEFLLEHTGGLDVSYDFSPHTSHPEQLSPCIILRGKSMSSKAQQLFDVMNNVVSSVDFSDVARIKELFMQHDESLTNSVRNNPMGYAVSYACSDKSLFAQMSYLASGLPYVRMIRELMKNFDQRADEIISMLQCMYKKCFIGKRRLVIGCQSSLYEQLQKNRFYGLLDQTPISTGSWENIYLQQQTFSQGFCIPAQAAFNVLSCSIGNLIYDYPEAGALNVAAEIIGNVVLHKRIREQGGAYGAQAMLHLCRGAFYCYSYRDPEVERTYQSFLYGIKEIAKGQFSEQDMHEGILEVIQSLDVPIAPGSRASTAYYRLRTGKIPALRQAFRHSVLSMTKERICESLNKYVCAHLDQATFVSFASEDILKSKSPDLKPEFTISNIF